MNHFPSYQMVVWFLCMAAHTVLVVLAVRNRVEQRDPIFAAYLYQALIQSVTILVIAQRGSQMTYFWSYYIGEFADHLLVLAVIWSIYYSVFGPARSLPVWVPRRALFLAGLSVVMGTAVASLCRWNFGSRIGPGRLTRLMLTAEQSLAAPAWFLLVGLIWFAIQRRYEWRPRIAGIAAGFVLVQTVDVVSVFLRSKLVGVTALLMSQVQTSAYLLSLIVWIVFLWKKEEVSVGATPEERELAFARCANAVDVLGPRGERIQRYRATGA